MTKEHKIILEKLKEYLERNPNQRFGQALFNLGINEFKENEEFVLRDIYGDEDSKIIIRIKKQLNWFDLQKKVQIGAVNIEEIGGMTVNERLYVSGLSNLFDEARENNKEHARFILESLIVDELSILKILE